MAHLVFCNGGRVQFNNYRPRPRRGGGGGGGGDFRIWTLLY